MKRREFIAGLGGALAWPLAARAQQGERVRRIGVLMGFDENDPEGKTRLSAFTLGLAELGWIDGRNVRIDVRWAAANVDRMRTVAKELVDLQPDVIVANAPEPIAVLKWETRTIPIVFVGVSDPVGAGFVASLPRPGGNITGFINFEGSMAGKWGGVAHGDRARRQAGRNHVQSRHGSRWRILSSARVRGGGPIVQAGADHGART
jgi:putative tryptophan/tyrosine transport system substrate-binding protein